MHNATALPEDLEAYLHDDFTDEEVKRWSEPSAPLVSILMPVYNAEKYLAAAIETCLAQTYPNWRLFIYDDCSTDGSLAIAMDFARNHPYSIRLSAGKERVDRLNAVFAFNALLEMCDGEIIAWQHADDLQDATRIDKQVVKLLSAKVDIVSCDMQLINSNDDLIRMAPSRQYRPPTPPIMCWRRLHSIDSVGLFDETYPCSFDKVWCYKAKRDGMSWAVLREPLYYYRQHRKQTMLTNEYLSQCIDELKRIEVEYGHT